jgi:hypothetical protein
MSFWRKRIVSPFVLSAALTGSVLLVPGSTFAIDPPQRATDSTADASVEVQLWSPATWVGWLTEWMTRSVRVTEGALSVESCIDAECSSTDSGPTGTQDPGTMGGEGDPTTDGGGGISIGG